MFLWPSLRSKLVREANSRGGSERSSEGRGAPTRRKARLELGGFAETAQLESSAAAFRVPHGVLAQRAPAEGLRKVIVALGLVMTAWFTWKVV